MLMVVDESNVVGFFMNAYAVFIIMSALISVFNVELNHCNVMSVWQEYKIMAAYPCLLAKHPLLHLSFLIARLMKKML
jgi:hypothetical protein